jgi:ppGpp synthetase/RelA/SpoT-type nucleotidyltranferase
MSNAKTITLTDALIQEVVDRYWRENDRYIKLANRVGEICRDLVSEATVRAHVTYRAKSPDRLKGKLKKYQADPSEATQLHSVEAVFARVGDLAGVRITTYEERDRSVVTEILRERFASFKGDDPVVDVKNKHDQERDNFYRATHVQVVLPSSELVGVYTNLAGLSCEIQVCSMLAHVWNEIEHDVRYKPFAGDLSKQEQELIQQLGHLTVAGDTTIRLLLEAVEARQKQQTGSFTDTFDFVARLRDAFPDLAHFGSHAQQFYEELLARGLDNPNKVTEHFKSEDVAALQTELDSLSGWLVEHEDMANGYLVRTGADVLMMALLRDSAQQIIDRHPGGRGKGRPPRIAWLARRYQQMKEASSTTTGKADADPALLVGPSCGDQPGLAQASSEVPET